MREALTVPNPGGVDMHIAACSDESLSLFSLLAKSFSQESQSSSSGRGVGAALKRDKCCRMRGDSGELRSWAVNIDRPGGTVWQSIFALPTCRSQYAPLLSALIGPWLHQLHRRDLGRLISIHRVYAFRR